MKVTLTMHRPKMRWTTCALSLFTVFLALDVSAKSETRYKRGDQHTVNGLSAFDLATNRSSVGQSSLVERTGGGGDTVNWGIRVWKRDSGGAETEITSGTPVAQVSRSVNGEGVQSANWNCPLTALSTNDAVVVRVYAEIEGQVAWTEQATLTTEQLGALELPSATWTLYYYTKYDTLSTGPPASRYTKGWFYWGNSTYDSRITNFSYTPPPTLSISDVAVTEGDSGTTNAVFTVAMSDTFSSDVTVDYASSNGTAEAEGDYASTNGTLTIAAGQTNGTITVAVNGDTSDEGASENFYVNLSNPDNATIQDGQGECIITDDDWELFIGDATVMEGDSGTTNAVFTVTLSSTNSVDVTVDFATSNGTAQAEGDYASTNGTLTIGAGQTNGTIIVAVNGDTLDEGASENFYVNLSNPGNAHITDGRGEGTITDDDDPPTLSIGDTTVTEGDAGTTNAAFTVTLSAASGLDVSVDFASSNGTALAEGDYASTNGALTIGAGQTNGTITVVVNGDTEDEYDSENFYVNLSNPGNATITDGQAEGTITDDDLPGLGIGDASVVEGDSGTTNAVFTVTLSASNFVDVTVDYAS
ncbi:MAG: Calx-beta domain-containing protein, partial [Kiritimatiellia bacterium]